MTAAASASPNCWWACRFRRSHLKSFVSRCRRVIWQSSTLSGATYAADAALQRGWVDEVVAPAQLMERSLAAAQELAALSPAAFAQTKKQIRQAVSERYAQSGAATDKAVTEIWAAPETLARIRDYVARTLKKS